MTATIEPTRLIFEAGPNPGDPPLEIDLGHVLVLIGPNNSGKSLTLREIESTVRREASNRKVVKEFDATFPTEFADAFKVIRPFITTEAPERDEVDQYQLQLHGLAGNRSFRIRKNTLEQALADREKERLASWLLAPYTVRLDGRSRFNLVNSKSLGSLRDTPKNHLWRLFNDTEARERVRELIEEALGLHFVLDPLQIGQLAIRLSQDPPPDELRRATISRDQRDYLDQAQPISEFGDGVQAFVGLISALHSLPHQLVLLDEPEAFLHPPLIRRLGAEAASVAGERGGTLIVATHSSDFLLGCLATTTKVDVVRLTYRDETATASQLDASRIRLLLHDPLLRSTGLASGLFHQACVVTEAARDRVFYNEMNRRLLRNGRGIEDSVFLNAQNWQTIARLVQPLRRIGVPAAAILDLDTITGNETTWKKIYKATGIPKNHWKRVNRLRSQVADAFDRLPPDLGKKAKIKRIGVQALGQSATETANELINYLARYGIFLVPVGEVESWFSSISVGGPKSEWLTRLFGKIGTFEDDPHYKQPGSDDVWKFLEQIAGWADDSGRDGMDL